MRAASAVATLFLGLGLAACSSDHAEYLDGGTGGGDCASIPAISVFASRCSSAGCHATGGQYPDLTASGLGSWKGKNSQAMPNEPLVVAGNPDASWLYRKVTGMQGASGGATMPLGAAMPIAEAAVIRDWIASGAQTSCSGAITPTKIDPNTLDQSALFRCDNPTAPRASVGRVRRIDRPEWTHGVGAPDDANALNLTAHVNPFSSQSAGAYSTYSDGLTVDDATLDLYFLNLPEAGVTWDNRLATVRTYSVSTDTSLQCFWNTAMPTSTCIDNYVTKLLKIGVLARTPTADEVSRLKAYAVAAIAREPGGGQTGASRTTTSREIAAAAWMTTGALFRSELGIPVEGDPAGRRRLSSEELALALGSVLSTHRPGAPLWTGFSGPAPDDAAPNLGWLQQVRAAANNGTIQDPAVMSALIKAYGSGVDLGRRDTLFESLGDTRDVPARGEYYLAPRITGFFREWLGYSGSLSSFKDTPGGTSRFMTTSSIYDRTYTGFVNLQTRFYMHDTTLVDQLDDTIARTVMESATARSDVFAALFTSLNWRLPSDQINLTTQTCTTNSDCKVAPNTVCNSVFKVCGDGVANTTSAQTRVYNIEGVPNTQAGRWVTMNPAERSGVLTHPAWLAAHGNNFEDDASLVHRGKWVREKLFCQTVPGLENVMVQAKLGARGPSARERVDTATVTGTSSATCLGCHNLMNTLGYPFEIYDHAGFLRATDHGKAPSGATTITNAPDAALNGSFQDAIAFSKAIAGSTYAKRCFVRQAFRYFTGRDETLQDACTLAAMESALGSGSFFDMLTVLVQSDTFLYRTVEGVSP